MTLKADNYYSAEADTEYMSVSQYKDFVGTYGRRGCEYEAMEKLAGRWNPEPTAAMTVGSYVDAFFEGTLDAFKEAHPEILMKNGGLKADFRKAEQVIERCTQDSYFMRCMSGEKQRIMTGEIAGVPWKIKMDSYLPGTAIVDMKVMKSIRETRYVRGLGEMPFPLYWGYDTQGAVYQEIVFQNTGERLPFLIAAVSKEDEPDIEVIEIGQSYLDSALQAVRIMAPEIAKVKTGERMPNRCGTCTCCRRSKILFRPVSLEELMEMEVS